MTSRTITTFLMTFAVTIALLPASACHKDSDDAASASAGKATTGTAAKPVARIVFVDKQNACDCTRARADTTWANLEQALAQVRPVPVERIYMDTEKDRAAPYLAQKSLMVVPGVYFLDADDGLLELLQGELSTDKLGAALGR